ALALAPDGKTVISSSYDQTLRLWDVATGKELRRFQGHERYVSALALSPDGKTLATVEARGNVIRLWDVATAKQVRQLKLPGMSPLLVVFSPNSTVLASSTTDHRIVLWDLPTGTAQPLPGHTHTILALAFSPDGKTLASAAYGEATICLWDVALRRRLRLL